MASPSMVQKSGDTLIVRSVVSGDRLYMDPGERSSPDLDRVRGADTERLPLDDYDGGSGDDAGKSNLPQCRVRRNYDCSDCYFYTQNPRHFLSHLRDVHGKKVQIYDCPRCLYASKHFQKLLRHMRMVHGVSKASDMPKIGKRKLKRSVSGEADRPQVDDSVEPPRPENGDADDGSPPANDDDQVDSGELSCSCCDFKTNSYNLLTRHERREHQKTKMYPCSKCNYVTHIKARFTKHVKYHSMPMIKCEECDFHTPYKWNLDRHMKNHGGNGAFCCSICNFTADIKQSLTVHETNHHANGNGDSGADIADRPPMVPRRRNRVGGSDSNPSTPMSPRTRHRTRLHPRNKLRLSRTSADGSVVAERAEDDLAEITLAGRDMACEKRKLFMDGPGERNGFGMYLEIDTRNGKPPVKMAKKTPRPIPNLIPLNAQSTPQVTRSNHVLGAVASYTPGSKATLETSENKDHYSLVGRSDCGLLSNGAGNPQPNCVTIKGDDFNHQQSLPIMAKYALKKKNSSIFDKLYQEKLKTVSEFACKDCGHVSKTVSEQNIHAKICTGMESKLSHLNVVPSGLGSTRCQHCRHRCKSSSDLVLHMQTCPLASKEKTSTEEAKTKDTKNDTSVQPVTDVGGSPGNAQGPHPMENIVFVWNTVFRKSDVSDGRVADLTPASRPNENVSEIKTPTCTPNQDKDNANSGKKVFKCPHCSFWASTASRFHVHIVGHLNKKPFECSLCSYKSNWRWDITKHIRLKSVRDPDHAKAKVLMTDETGRRNYSKYNKYLTLLQVTDMPADVGANSGNKKQREMIRVSDVFDSDVQSPPSAENARTDTLAEIFTVPMCNNAVTASPIKPDEKVAPKRNKRTTWKCKKCDYRNPSKEALLVHIRKHSKTATVVAKEEKKEEEKKTMIPDNLSMLDVSYRCGHCNQVSNWKHVIQRHCRLKHNGDVKVDVSTNVNASTNEPSASSNESQNMSYNMKCSKCPFTTSDKLYYESHLKQHVITSESTFKCFICPYYVKTESELLQHLPLHGILDSEKAKPPPATYNGTSIESVTVKKYKCGDCPYVTNSKSQFTYHEQFHKANDSPFKCEICNYQVTKRHLLHQHMKVHGPNATQNAYVESTPSDLVIVPIAHDVNNKEDKSYLQLMWVSYKGEFHKLYQCRSCPYVNAAKSKIFDHEKMHYADPIENNENLFRCVECNYTCDNINVYLSHGKVHKENYVKVLCKVNILKKDEDQIEEFKKLALYNKSLLTSPTNEKLFRDRDPKNSKLLYFCSDCPARFFSEKDLKIHFKFHCAYLPFVCKVCSYSSRQHSHLAAHYTVHSVSYQDKTKSLLELHIIHKEYPQPRLVTLSSDNEESELWIVVAEPVKDIPKNNLTPKSAQALSNSKEQSKQYHCNQCPAKFFKTGALNYHLNLHGGDGSFKCRRCNYAVKTIGNLAKHEVIHAKTFSDRELNNKTIPLSGTDLYQQKTNAEKLVLKPNDFCSPTLQADRQFGLLIHGNPEFIYPGCLKNGKLKEKKYKCHKCPSAFEKREQYKVHLSLHGSKQKYKCDFCDYSVKYYANFAQHAKKHIQNAEAQEAQVSPPDKFEEPVDHSDKTVIKVIPKQPNKDTTKISTTDQQTLKLTHNVKQPNKDTTKIPAADQQALKLTHNVKQPNKDTTKISATDQQTLKLTHNVKQPNKDMTKISATDQQTLKLTHNVKLPNKDTTKISAIDQQTFKLLHIIQQINKDTTKISGTEQQTFKLVHIIKQPNKDMTTISAIDQQTLKLMHNVKQPNEDTTKITTTDQQISKLAHNVKQPNMDTTEISTTDQQISKPAHNVKQPNKDTTEISTTDQQTSKPAHNVNQPNKDTTKISTTDQQTSKLAHNVKQPNKDTTKISTTDQQTSKLAHNVNQPNKDTTKISTTDQQTSKLAHNVKQPNKDTTKISITDQQISKLAQIVKQPNIVNNKDTIQDDRKIRRCTYCPHTSQRRDKLDNHMKRHMSISGISSNYMCPYCDYAAPQFQFLRDHIKLHFQVQRHRTPENFANFEGLEILMTRLADRKESMPQTKKEHLFTMKENMAVPKVYDNSAKVYVIPNIGEKVFVEH